MTDFVVGLVIQAGIVAFIAAIFYDLVSNAVSG